MQEDYPRLIIQVACQCHYMCPYKGESEEMGHSSGRPVSTEQRTACWPGGRRRGRGPGPARNAALETPRSKAGCLHLDVRSPTSAFRDVENGKCCLRAHWRVHGDYNHRKLTQTPSSLFTSDPVRCPFLRRTVWSLGLHSSLW